MNKWKRIGITVLVFQITILIYSIFFESAVGLNIFVNGNFYIGTIFLMAGLFVMVSKNGFFDVITNGIRHVFFRRQMEGDEEGYRSFSALLNFSADGLIKTGAVLIGLSIICLFFVL
ncbi:MAG TPA: DUF3899 domain-containing protein [Bacillus sp. (in: firmicutes)]|uniref:DUF3899 domain-containing protein n=1 Tax=Bacillus litorisediminis TaxID=2922713 RepID=UPI001FACFA48|nr:DUF3899 domain-containing protein [Bacillus litorisediminis]HWO77500.1 DUF3899 domain-containing protein [Bacillus sp. (in: firmicutes)]